MLYVMVTVDHLCVFILNYMQETHVGTGFTKLKKKKKMRERLLKTIKTNDRNIRQVNNKRDKIPYVP